MEIDFSLTLPDISVARPIQEWGVPLSWVGMSDIEAPIRQTVSYGGKDRVTHLPARIDFQVNLQSTEARGIHMSRLYRLLNERLLDEELDFPLLERLTEEALRSHAELSTAARVRVRFDLPVERFSLKSGLSGWRTYPVELISERREGRSERSLQTQVLYSSTCPASTALAEQLQGRRPVGSGFVATPHAQRSQARVCVRLMSSSTLGPLELIDLVEGAVKTPVQTAVRREDEQEFARLNAENTMFCEDAARRISAALAPRSDILSFSGEVRHFESLHPHDAVAVFSSSP